MIHYLIVPLDRHATSFCHYENPAYGRPGAEPLPAASLKRIVDYAVRNKISINFLYGTRKLPAAQAALVERVEHVKIVPLKLAQKMPGAIVVINPDDLDAVKDLGKNAERNLILRLERAQLGRLAKIFRALAGRYKRLNLCLLNIADYRDEDLDEYRRQLEIIERQVVPAYRRGHTTQLSFITDRLLLKNMNNCDAGIRHLTAGPGGKLYLCPGFLHHEDAAGRVGGLAPEIAIPNGHLLELGRAPICSACDAYQCKRCVFLNRMITGEVNTPSRQQCIAAHLERNLSRRVLEALRPSVPRFKKFIPIPEIPYLDPFEQLNRSLSGAGDPRERERLVAGLLSQPLQGLTTRELLYQIYRLDRSLLTALKNRLS